MYNGELIVDLFAGGGGASTGIEMALGVSPDIAVNHDPQAIALHAENHTKTKHYIEDVFDVDPVEICEGKPVALLWLSPDCKHFSKAKGAAPVSCEVRSLATVGIRWAKEVRPTIIMLENVEEFKTWGPLCENNKPIKERQGELFNEYVSDYNKLGYEVDWQELKASDYGAPTTRKRLFLVARCDGADITFPTATHGDPKKLPERKPWKTAAECIDWSVPAHSIFLTKDEGKEVGVRRPLVDNTMKRIANGIKKFVLDNSNPFVLDSSTTFVPTFYGETKVDAPRGSYMDSTVGTITAGGGRHALVVPFMKKYGLDHKKLGDGGEKVYSYIMKYYGQGEGSTFNDPAHTITTKERFAIVNVHEVKYEIVDISMRMLTPRELYRAQGFPDSYKINMIYNNRKFPKSAQVRMCGNSVVPALAKALIQSNFESLYIKRTA